MLLMLRRKKTSARRSFARPGRDGLLSKERLNSVHGFTASA
jgi:hypothetical protein